MTEGSIIHENVQHSFGSRPFPKRISPLVNKTLINDLLIGPAHPPGLSVGVMLSQGFVVARPRSPSNRRCSWGGHTDIPADQSKACREVCEPGAQFLHPRQ